MTDQLKKVKADTVGSATGAALLGTPGAMVGGALGARKGERTRAALAAGAAELRRR